MRRASSATGDSASSATGDSAGSELRELRNAAGLATQRAQRLATQRAPRRYATGDRRLSELRDWPGDISVADAGERLPVASRATSCV